MSAPRPSRLPRLLDRRAVADWLGVGVKTVDRMLAGGDLPTPAVVIQRGDRRLRRWTEAQLAALVRQNAQDVP